MYYKEVDKRHRRTMKALLKKHFRYHTMNSWNRSTSYANCIKLHQVNKPSDIDTALPARRTFMPSASLESTGMWGGQQKRDDGVDNSRRQQQNVVADGSAIRGRTNGFIF